MAEQTIKEMLKMIDAKIEHIEDITADNRAVIIKLVKQSNQIVRFLSSLEIEDVSDSFEDITSPALSESEKIRSKFDYIFKMKIIDFYLGKKLNI